jgi:phosphate butyryltransferase
MSAERGLIEPILIGDPDKIAEAAAALGRDISAWTVTPERDHHAAAARAVAMALAGQAQAIMKGAIHSDELLAAVVKKDGGLRTHVRLSHVFVLDVPTLDELLFISDAAINIAPDLLAKVDIVQNAIDLARACGLDKPHVGILSAVETINPNIPSTLDAAILSKMAERGQIKGGVVDGPLAMDNAIDVQAAQTKGIASLVAGHANVLITPNLEAGNMLAKELTFVARAEAAGLVVGAQVPVMLTSRADNDRARLASSALAQLYAYWRREGRAFAGSAK